MFRCLLSVTACVVMAGCNIAMPLTAENAVTISIASAHNSERAYRNTLDAMRSCYPAGFTIERDYLPDSKEGEIVLAAVDTTYRAESIKIQVKPAASGGSIILLTKRKNASLDWDRAVKDWTEGRSDLCPNGTRSDPRPPGSETGPQSMPGR